jgi:hypothetical protein
MSDNHDRYYRPSGRIPFFGTVLMLGLGTLVALISSFVYAVICRYNPIIYIQIFVVLGFGAVMGMTVNRVGHTMKVRNRFFAILITMVIGMLGLYFAWVWYIWMLWDWDTNLLIFQPTITWEIMQVLADRGIWTLQDSTPTGMVLFGFWLVEAAIVLGMCYLTGAESGTPFCEECNCWTLKRDALRIAKADPTLIAAALEDEQYGIIPPLAAGEIDPADYMSVLCYTCPNCEDSGYLTVSNVVIVQGKEGPEIKVTQFVPPIAVPHSLTQEIEHMAQAAEVKTIDALTKDLPELD